MEMAASSTHQESKTERKKLGSSRPTLTVPPRNSTEAFLKGSDAATPSPLTFVSSLFADQDPYAGDVMSFSQLLAGAIASPSATHMLGDGLMKPIGFSSTPDGNPPSSSGGHASAELPPCSHAAKFKSMMPPRLPIPRSPLLTIPPGLSPTSLLDSPIFFPMGLAEPSPTTSAFFFSPLINEGGFTGTFMSGNDKDGSSGQDGSPTFTFKAHPQLPNSPLASMGPYGLSHQQALAQVQAQAHSLISIGAETSAIEGTPTVPAMSGSVSDSPEVLSHSVGLLEPAEETAIEHSSPSHDVSTSHPLPHLVERPSEDGYNWRKYGQKQVKGSEYPRAYYKCTHPGCAVKKKVERSYGGQITEIVYKGEHNHAKPQCTRRPATSNAHVTNGLGRDLSQSRSGVTLETSGPVNDRGQLAGGVDGTPEPSLNSLSNDEAEDGGDDHSGSKRMRLEKAAGPAANPPLSTVKEPRVVVQTTSDIDILDDGYRWRKYGRKVVKGNPYPRSYYRCTSAGCTVRKHVERSSSDPKSVITTYEGKHNHAVPQTRNSSSNGPPAAATSASSEPMRHVLLGSDPKGRRVKGAISLQEQVFGRMFVEGHKTETSMETSSTHGRSMHKALMDDQRKMEGGTEAYLTLAEGKMGSGHFEEALGFRPKEELSQEVVIL